MIYWGVACLHERFIAFNVCFPNHFYVSILHDLYLLDHYFFCYSFICYISTYSSFIIYNSLFRNKAYAYSRPSFELMIICNLPFNFSYAHFRSFFNSSFILIHWLALLPLQCATLTPFQEFTFTASGNKRVISNIERVFILIYT